MFNSVKGLFTIILLAALATLGMANERLKKILSHDIKINPLAQL